MMRRLSSPWCPVWFRFLTGGRLGIVPKAAVFRVKAVGTGGTGGDSVLAGGVVGQAPGKIMYNVLGATFTHIWLTSGKILNGYRHIPSFLSCLPITWHVIQSCALSEIGWRAGKGSKFEFSIALVQAIGASRACGVGIHAFRVFCQAAGEIADQVFGSAFIEFGVTAVEFLFRPRHGEPSFLRLYFILPHNCGL